MSDGLTRCYQAVITDLSWKFNYNAQSSLPTGEIFQLNVCSDQDHRVSYLEYRVCLEYVFENIIPNLHANVKNQSFKKLSFSFDLGRTGRRADSRRVTGRLILELQMRLQVYLNIPISHFIFFMGLTLTELSIYSLYVETQLCPLPRSYYCDKHRELLDRPPESIFS